MDAKPEIAVADNPEQDRYEVRAGGELAGFTQYKLAPGRISFIHTEVDDRFEGQGLGSRLVAFALDDARARGLDVLPFCPFVRAYIQRHPDYLDLVPEARRPQFDL
ncbi:MAG TPA: GNAT family N-acetyltransferase [Solirubrobacterales bacterium]|nr:GNAT family N-acetyltransferase [Solirubrobacterales bacterium]